MGEGGDGVDQQLGSAGLHREARHEGLDLSKRGEDDSIVGFSSLAATGWQKWPPPDGKRSRLLYVPQLGLDQKFRGYPPDPEWRYSNQILEHLIGEAVLLAKQIQQEKPPSKHVDLITLKVHRDNVAARRLYERYGFELLHGFDDNEHLMMSHKLGL